MKKSILSRITSVFAAVVVCCTLFFCGFVASAEATGKTGWVEVRIAVPANFQENIFVTFVNKDTFEEYSTQVMAANDYEMSFQLPVGRYKFDGAFLANGDFRYNTELTNDTANFTVAADAKKAVLVTLKTVYNDDYSNGAQASPLITTEPSEPTDSTAVPDSTDPSLVTTPVSDPTTGGVSEPNEITEVEEDTAGSFLIAPEESSSLSVVQRLLYSLIGSVAFVLVVVLFVYLYRKHIEEN